MHKFVREREGLGRRREQRKFVDAQCTPHQGAVGPVSQLLCSKSFACTRAPSHQAWYAREPALHCPCSSLFIPRVWQEQGLQPHADWEEGWASGGCRDFSRQQPHLCSISLPKLVWFAPLYRLLSSWHAGKGGQHQQNLNTHWQMCQCRQVLGVECTTSALAAVADAPATWTAYTQREMHFPHGKVKEDAQPNPNKTDWLLGVSQIFLNSCH